jgi:hypothetical protein
MEYSRRYLSLVLVGVVLLDGCIIIFEVMFFPSKPLYVSLAHLQKGKSTFEFIYYGTLGLLWAHVKYGLL